jgi:ligand-binding sensor domain-containing protein
MAQAGEDLYLAAQSGVLARDSAGDFKLLTLAGVDLVHPLQAIAGYGRYLFMATQSGLVIYDVETDRYERIGLNDGLLSDQINGLWADATHLWIATPKGLSRFNYHAVMP